MRRPRPSLADRLEPFRPNPSDLPAMVLTFAIGIAGGFAARAVGLPLPWMLGPMIFCTAAALARAPLRTPKIARPIVIPIIGVMLGASFTPDIVNQLGAWLGTFVVLPVFLVAAGGVAWAFYRFIGRYDSRTAFFCSAPGGINEMIVLGAEAGADERKIALAHAVRIFFVITLIALGFATLAGTTTAGLDGAHTAFSDLGPSDALLMLACAIFGPSLAQRVRLPAASLFGPMILSAALHLTAIVETPPPTFLVIVAQIVIGTVLGCRFVGARLRETGHDILLGFASSVILVTVTLIFAALVAGLTTAPWSQAVLAYAPGGLTEMSLLALAKNQDVAYVATAHVARIVLVLFAVPILFGAIGKRL